MSTDLAHHIQGTALVDTHEHLGSGTCMAGERSRHLTRPVWELRSRRPQHSGCIARRDETFDG